MPRETVLESVTIYPDGRTVVRVAKQVVENSETLLSQPHIHEIPASEPIADGLLKLRNALTALRFPALSQADAAFVASRALPREAGAPVVR